MLAFGDSITFGSNAICSGSSATALRWTPSELLMPFAELPPPPSTSYPSVLQASLRARYTAQNPVVINAGFPLESANDGDTRRRFTSALATNAPEIVLLQEGINDLHGFDFYGIPYAQGIEGVVRALRDMSLEARGRGIHVFLGTLLPERANGCRAFAIPPKAKQDLITPTNDQIRSMAAAQGIDLIDLAMVFSGQDSYIGQDGLHPSDAGYSAMAKAFFDAIRAKFERPTASSMRR
jgi:lysophospholipase L1-like esterase